MTDFGDMSMDDAIAHFGVKGMKWGIKQKVQTAVNGAPDKSGVTRKDVRQAKNDAYRKAQRKVDDELNVNNPSRDKNIKAARSELKDAARRYEDASVKYKRDKERIGKNAAKKALIRSRVDYDSKAAKANQETSTEELGRIVSQAFFGAVNRNL